MSRRTEVLFMKPNTHVRGRRALTIADITAEHKVLARDVQ